MGFLLYCFVYVVCVCGCCCFVCVCVCVFCRGRCENNDEQKVIAGDAFLKLWWWCCDLPTVSVSHLIIDKCTRTHMHAPHTRMHAHTHTHTHSYTTHTHSYTTRTLVHHTHTLIHNLSNQKLMHRNGCVPLSSKLGAVPVLSLLLFFISDVDSSILWRWQGEGFWTNFMTSPVCTNLEF